MQRKLENTQELIMLSYKLHRTLCKRFECHFWKIGQTYDDFRFILAELAFSFNNNNNNNHNAASTTYTVRYTFGRFIFLNKPTCV